MTPDKLLSSTVHLSDGLYEGSNGRIEELDEELICDLEESLKPKAFNSAKFINQFSEELNPPNSDPRTGLINDEKDKKQNKKSLKLRKTYSKKQYRSNECNPFPISFKINTLLPKLKLKEQRKQIKIDMKDKRTSYPCTSKNPFKKQKDSCSADLKRKTSRIKRKYNGKQKEQAIRLEIIKATWGGTNR